MQIADIKIKNKVFLAPMAGVTDRIYRQIIKRFGCGLVYSEMVSAQAINMHNKKTIDMLEINNDERPVAIQIFGSNAAEFVKAATFVETTYHPDIIDINMGCPVPKIAIKSQAGSALMKNPNKIKNILIAVTAAIKTPITIKIRSGWDENSINAVAVAKIAQECGVSAITVHPRTRKQGYSGLADWTIIKLVKEAVSIPVIGNGDINSPQKAVQMLRETNCDAVMIGRAAIGNPWIIQQCVAHIANKTVKQPTLKDKVELMVEHLQSLIKAYGSKQGICIYRSYTSQYLKGYENSRELVNKINTCNDENKIITELKKFSNSDD